MKRIIRDRTKATPARVAIAAELYQGGRAVPAIARRLGVCHRTVQRMLARAGVAMRVYTSATRCPVRRCTEPPMKRRNGNGYLYGRRCRAHQLAHQRAMRRRRLRRRARVVPMAIAA
jgi:DNA-binding transcriptional regulator LsrR (DeoR family)